MCLKSRSRATSMVLERISNYIYFIFLKDFLLVKRSDSYNRAIRVGKTEKKKKSRDR